MAFVLRFTIRVGLAHTQQLIADVRATTATHLGMARVGDSECLRRRMLFTNTFALAYAKLKDTIGWLAEDWIVWGGW